MSAADKWKIGDAIEGRWEILKILSGGMGTVYVVYDREWSEPFAVKTFRDDVFRQNPRIADRFVDEARAWTNLDDHENIVRARLPAPPAPTRRPACCLWRGRGTP